MNGSPLYRAHARLASPGEHETEPSPNSLWSPASQPCVSSALTSADHRPAHRWGYAAEASWWDYHVLRISFKTQVSHLQSNYTLKIKDPIGHYSRTIWFPTEPFSEQLLKNILKNILKKLFLTIKNFFCIWKFPWMFKVLQRTIDANKDPYF